MRSIYFLLCVCSSLTPLLAYVVDYNETGVEIVMEARENLRNTLLEQDFPFLLQEYNNDISRITTQTYGKLKSKSEIISEHLVDVKESASKASANSTTCLEKLNLLTPEEFYQTYTEGCVNPARALGLNLIEVGQNKREIYFKKYDELMMSLFGCLTGADPVPHICAGVIESTILEIQRITPGVNGNYLNIERELKQELLKLSECAYDYVSLSSKRLEMEFNKAKTCVLDKINTA